MRIAIGICTVLASLLIAPTAFASAEHSFAARGRLICGTGEIEVDRVTVTVGPNARTIQIAFMSGSSDVPRASLDLDIQPNDGSIKKGHVRAYRMVARCSQRTWSVDRELGQDPGDYDDFESLTMQLWMGGRMAARVVGKDPRSDDLAWLLEFDGVIR